MTPEQRLKYSAAQAFEAVLRKAGYRIRLGGGGGATTLGGPRPVKDLDFKMGDQLELAWKCESSRNNIIQTIKSGMEGYGYKIVNDNTHAKKQLEHVLRLKVRDSLSGDMKVRTYKAKEVPKVVKKVVNQEEIEISLTNSGQYDERPHWESYVGQALFMHPVDPAQLILDKVFVLAQRPRGEHDKIRTDFEDLAALLEKYGAHIQRELSEVRMQGDKRKLFEVRMQGDNKVAGRPPGLKKSVTEEVQCRINQIQIDLNRPPAWSRLQEQQLREVEVKFLVERVKKFLMSLEAVINKLQNGVRS